jgi:hypothetical protein
VQATGWAAFERRIAGGQSIPFLEAEEADDAVDVQKEKRLFFLSDHEKM